MIDPGHPFSKPYKTIIDSLEESIREGVEQPAVERLVFQSDKTTYELRRQVYAITQVSGLVGSTFTVFTPDVHYRRSNNRLIWLHETEKPADGARLEVQYTYRERPTGLTDFNPGSVIGTLVRTVAREMKLMYEQMDQAYRRAFIDQAAGVALDNVVALLGVTRKSATHATGTVTFFRKTPTSSDLPIPAGTRIADESERVFVTTEGAVLAAEVVENQAVVENAVTVVYRIAALVGIWREEDATDAEPVITADTPDLEFSPDERSIILPPESGLSGKVRVRYNPKSVSVPVQAIEAGPEGNVNAGAIVIMPTPPSGIEGVENEAPIEGGLAAESDDQLRERAKYALEQSGNATLTAIKFAVLDIEGVTGVDVVDHSLDETIPLGEVRVRYSGGDSAVVWERVEQTRAAGIIARLEEINEVFIAGTFYLIPDVAPSTEAVAQFLADVIEAVEALTIGQSLSVRRLNALAYQVGGLADVAEAQLAFSKDDLENPGETITGPVVDPFLIQSTEIIQANQDDLQAILLRGIQGQRQGGSKLTLEVWLEDSAANPVTFANLTLDVTVTLRAALQNTPNQPPERVGIFTTPLTFSNQSIATLTIIPAQHAPDFRADGPDPHVADEVEAVISAAAYAGLQPTGILTLDFTP